MMIAGQHWIPLPTKKAKTNGKHQPQEEILNEDSRPALDPLPIKKKRSVGWVYVSEEAFNAFRTPVCAPAVLADDKKRKRVPAKLFDI